MLQAVGGLRGRLVVCLHRCKPRVQRLAGDSVLFCSDPELVGVAYEVTNTHNSCYFGTVVGKKHCCI
jgi:hypothetical protein